MMYHPVCYMITADVHQVRYYTFWAVVWVGGVSLGLSVIQCILSIIQVVYAAKATQ